MAIRRFCYLLSGLVLLSCSDPTAESSTDDRTSDGDDNDLSSGDGDDKNSETDDASGTKSHDDDDSAASDDDESTVTSDSDKPDDASDDETDTSDNESTSSTSSEEEIPCVDKIEISEDFLEQKLSELSGKVPVMIDGNAVMISERATNENRTNARHYLREFYEDLGYVVTEQPYGDKGVNLIAERKTESDKIFLVGAHYDSVSGGPGADDDGGGVVQGMAMALALQDCQIEHTLRIVAFDQEELGLLGSRAYANSIEGSGEKDSVIGVLQQEMPGWDNNGDAVFQIIDCDRSESKFLTDGIRDAIMLKDIEATAESECTDRSDHASFWEIGLPAVMTLERYFGEQSDINPCYHKPCDTVDDLDFSYMRKIVWANTVAVAKWLGAP